MHNLFIHKYEGTKNPYLSSCSKEKLQELITCKAAEEQCTAAEIIGIVIHRFFSLSAAGMVRASKNWEFETNNMLASVLIYNLIV